MVKSVWKWMAMVFAIVAVGVAGFLVGQHVAASQYQAEREQLIQVNRSDLEGLAGLEGTVYVTGHKSPDLDTVGSAIAYATLLQKLGYDAQPVVLEEVNNETKYVLETGGIDTPMQLEDASGCNMVLVDHGEYAQSAEGLRDANVVAIIDHHGSGSVTTGNGVIYDARPLGSTATIIWMRYRDYGIEIDQKTAYAMVGAILSDTVNLQSDMTTLADRKALKELAEIAGIDDTDALHREMFKASISYDGMTDEEIFFDDYKEYEAGGKEFGIGCVNAYDEDDAKDLVARMGKVLAGAQVSTSVDMAYAQISILHDGISVVYLVPSSEIAAGVIETAFGDKAVSDGTAYRFEPGMSRRQVLVPAITDVLEAYPKE